MNAIVAETVQGVPESVLRRQRTGFGFYVYLLSDGILFATLFAAFAVLRHATAGGPDGHELLGLRNAFVETVCLLTSSFACGLAMLAVDRRLATLTQAGLVVTVLLGAVFVGLEFHEFSHLIGDGAGPSRSAFLSAFFLLVGTHGLHVTAGLFWAVVLMIQLSSRGVTSAMTRRLICFSLFWHVLDVVWIGVFTFVYLVGARL